MIRCISPSIEEPIGNTYIYFLSLHPMPKHFPYTISHTYMTYIFSHLGNTPNLRRIIPIGHPETLSKHELLNCIKSLSICLGKGGFDANVWVISLLDVIDISMIHVTYNPMEGVLFFVVGPCPVDRYIWGDDYLEPPWGSKPTDGCCDPNQG
jgi:hypothetical protein